MDNEYIRRDVALRAVAKRYGACRSPAQNRLLDEIRNEIRRAPAVDVVPVVHGSWIPNDTQSPCDEWDCTACGERRTFMCEMDMDDMQEFYKYCPNCGARMDGKETK